MLRFYYKGFGGCDCVCGLDIRQLTDGRTLVVCTELPENTGTSITNMAEHLAAAVARKHNVPGEKLVWMEYYPAEGRQSRKATCDLVTFAVLPSGQIDGSPRWKRCTAEDWRALQLPEDMMPEGLE